MTDKRRVLIADDQKEVTLAVAEIIKGAGFVPVIVLKGEDAVRQVVEDPAGFHLAILDYDFGRKRKNGLEVFKEIKKEAPDLPVVFLTGQGTISVAVDAMKMGALDFIEKDTRLEDNLERALQKLKNILKLFEENKKLRQENETLKTQMDFYHDEQYKKYAIVGTSDALKETIHTIERVAPIPRPVLITGERGTGKELIAAAIHQASPRKNAPFVTINCGGLAEGLLECELFGQEENAYPNAPFRRGRFEMAHRGTLFLDEVGNMPYPFQQTVLRIIEYQKFERVGGSQAVQVDVRVIAATNADLKASMDKGEFRADLYDRLAFEVLRLPSLRERLEDLEALTKHFLNLIALEVPGIRPTGFSEEAIRLMQDHAWPGNVRELKFFVERLAYRVQKPVIEASDLPPLEKADSDARPLTARIDAYRAQVIATSLREAGGDAAKTAQRLGIPHEEVAAVQATLGPENSRSGRGKPKH